MRRMRQIAWVGLLAAAVLAGCERRAGQIDGGAAALPAGEDSAAYIDRMSSQKTATENDALRGMLMLLDGKDDAATFAKRVDLLRTKGVVSKSWSFDAQRPITRGKLAYMVYQGCKVPGGVMLTLTGPSPRYCLRELRYRGMMGEGSDFNPVTGMEFVAVLNRADIYKRTGKFPNAVNLPSDR